MTSPRILAALLLAGLLVACQTTRTVDGVPVATNNRAPLPGATEGDVHQRSAARLRLAAGYYQAGQLQVAIDATRKALEIDPDSAQGHALLGVLLLDLGQIENANASYQRALALGHDDPSIANNYGWFLCRTHREHESFPWFEKAAADRLYATPAQALLNEGICRMQINDDEAAEAVLMRALAFDGTLAGVKYQLARVHLRRHQPDRAAFYFDLLEHSGNLGPDVLWLGIRVAHARGDAATEQRLADDLRGRFPEAAENEALRRGDYRD